MPVKIRYSVTELVTMIIRERTHEELEGISTRVGVENDECDFIALLSSDPADLGDILRKIFADDSTSICLVVDAVDCFEIIREDFVETNWVL